MSSLKRSLLSGSILLTGLFVQAQNLLSLHQALASMEKNYPSLQIKRSLVEAARAHALQVAHERTPSLKLMEQFEGGTNNNLIGTIFPNGIVPSVGGGNRRNNISDVQFGNIAIGLLEWELINFGAYRAKDLAAKANIEVQQYDLEKEQFLMQGAVLGAYYDVLKNYYLLQYSRREIDRIKTIRQAIGYYAQNGLRPGVDSVIADAELSKARLANLETVRQLALAKNVLALITGLDTSALNPDSVNDFSPQQISWHKGVQDSIQYHPVLQHYQSIYRNNLANEGVIRKSYRPKISLLGSAWLRGSTVDATDDFHHPVSSAFTQTRSNYLAGIAVTYNPFDLRKKHDQLTEQQFRTRASYQQYTLQQEELQSAISQADINESAAIQKLKEIPVQLQAATDAYDQKLALYNSGLANIIDVVNAYYVLNRAETDMVEAKNEFWKSVFQKAYASNQLDHLLSLLK